MKLIRGVVGIILGFLLADVSGVFPTDDEREQQSKLYRECLRSSGIDEGTMNKMKEWKKFPKLDEKIHLKCNVIGLGIIKKDGTIDVGAIEKVFKGYIPDDKGKKIAQKCNVQQKNLEETALWVARCMFKEFQAAEGE